jgi:hypothetical protein
MKTVDKECRIFSAFLVHFSYESILQSLINRFEAFRAEK